MYQPKLVFLLGIFFVHAVGSIRVCKSFWGYFIPWPKKCYQNLDVKLNNTEIITTWGFNAEEYIVETEDNYILTVIRLFKSRSKGTPVVLGHGMFMNSLGFSATRNKSLAYILANSGYDVWLCNFRGTRYSRRNSKLEPNNREFWQFSFHEIGMYDLPKILTLVQEKTQQKAVYIGFSMGTTAAYIYTSSMPEDSKDKLKGFISLSPVAYMANIKSVLRIGSWFWPFVKVFAGPILHGEMLRGANNIKYLCAYIPFVMPFCEFGKIPVFGINLGQIDWEYSPVTTLLVPDTISEGVLTHYANLIKSGKFLTKDSGFLYQKEYALENIAVPHIIFVGTRDLLGTVDNADHLYNKLDPSVRHGFKKVLNFNHGDFVMAKDVHTLLYDDVVSAVRLLDSGVGTRKELYY